MENNNIEATYDSNYKTISRASSSKIIQNEPKFISYVTMGQVPYCNMNSGVNPLMINNGQAILEQN